MAVCRSPTRVVLRGLCELCGEFCAATYINRRLWITFWRRFWGVFLGDFWEPIGPGARVRGLFSADGVPWVRWASANLHFFAVFCGFLAGFCRLFVAIWCFSHPCHLHTFMLITFFPRLWHGTCTAFTAEDAEACPERAERVEGAQRKAEMGGKATANGTAFNAEIEEHAEGGLGGMTKSEGRMTNE